MFPLSMYGYEFLNLFFYTDIIPMTLIKMNYKWVDINQVKIRKKQRVSILNKYGLGLNFPKNLIRFRRLISINIGRKYTISKLNKDMMTVNIKWLFSQNAIAKNSAHMHFKLFAKSSKGADNVAIIWLLRSS